MAILNELKKVGKTDVSGEGLGGKDKNLQVAVSDMLKSSNEKKSKAITPSKPTNAISKRDIC